MRREFTVTIPFPAHLDADEAASLVENMDVLGDTLNHKFGLVPSYSVVRGPSLSTW